MRHARTAAPRAARLARVAAALLLAAGCRDRQPEQLLPAASPSHQEPGLRSSGLRAGGPAADPAITNPYATDAAAVAEGRALFVGMNCAGCHGPAGGGGIGPPLADA